MYIYLPLAVCIIGGLIICLVDCAKYPKLCKIGDVMFWTGMLAFLMTYHGGGPSLTIR